MLDSGGCDLTLAELATRYEALSRTAHARGLAGAATRVRDEVEHALEPHRRTGVAADTLTVTATPAGVQIDGARYLPFIKGVPRGEALEAIAVQGYAEGVRAALGGSA